MNHTSQPAIDLAGELERDRIGLDAVTSSAAYRSVMDAPPSTRGADRTWSLREMVSRLAAARSDAILAGEAWAQCLAPPAEDAPGRAAHDEAVKAYIDIFGSREETHRRVELLDDYLDGMTTPAPGVGFYGVGHREACEEEYRFAREVYQGQRSWVRDLLHLDDDAPSILCVAMEPAGAEKTSSFHDRLIIGHDANGYRVGLVPNDPSGAVVWSEPTASREDVVALSVRLHLADPVAAVAMEIEMVDKAESAQSAPAP